jgi:PTH1 family peptidyl-tRNA hydrolase
MILLVGLGNPGKKYERTRHNAGYRIIDELAKQKPNGFVLAKLKTFMNQSGKSVKALITKYQIQNTNLWVAHDDIDLPLGVFKIQKGRGAAGHKGVRSIINELRTKDFWRVRIGICPKRGKPKNVERFVLQNFTKPEERAIKEAVGKAVEAIKKHGFS